MSKITLTTFGSLQNDTSATADLNSNFSTIQTAFDNTLSRDGTSPNQMGSSLDMNSNQIINLPAPVSNFSPVRLVDITSIGSGGSITVNPLPTGGVANQVLIKNSSVNFDVSWATNPPQVGRVIVNYTPNFNLAGNLLDASQLFTTTGVVVPVNANYSDIRLSQLSGGNNTFTLGSGALVACIYAQPEALSSSSLTSNMYAAVLQVVNDGPGTTKGIHTGAFANAGSSGVLVGVNSQIQPVSTSGYSSAFFSSLTSSGVNNLAIGVGIESTGDQYLYGVGSAVNPLPVGTAYYSAWMATSSATNARAYQIRNNASSEIAFWDKNGNIGLGIAGQSAAPQIQFTGQTSGSATLTAQAVAANALLTLPQSTGTLVSAATSPLAIGSATGNISINTNGVTNSLLAQMAANTIKGNNTNGTTNAADLTVSQVQGLTSQGVIAIPLGSVNMNSVADTAIPISLPTGYSNYRVSSVNVYGSSTSLTSATAALYTAASGGGIAVGTATALSGITSTSANALANTTVLTLASPNPWLTSSNLYFRVTVAQGAPATASVTLYIQPLS